MRKRFLGLAALVVVGWAGCASKEQTSLKIYVQQKLYDKAITQGLLALQKTPDSGDTHYFIGVAYYGKDHELSEEAPGYADSAEAWLGRAYKHFLEAKRLAAAQWGKDADAYIRSMWAQHYNRGVTYTKKGENAKAAVEYRLATLADPEDYQGFYAHAAALLPMAREAKRNDKEEDFKQVTDAVIRDLDKVIELKPAEKDLLVSTWHSRGEVLYLRGETKGAQESYAKAVELDPENYELMSTMADRFYKEQDWENAGIYYGQSLAIQERLNLIDEGDMEVYSAYASSLLKLFKWEEAIDTYEKAAKLKPSDAVSLYNVMVTRYKYGDALDKESKMDEAKTQYAKCIEIGGELIRLDSTRPEYWQVLGYCRRAMGDTTGAARDLKKFQDLRSQQSAR